MVYHTYIYNMIYIIYIIYTVQYSTVHGTPGPTKGAATWSRRPPCQCTLLALHDILYIYTLWYTIWYTLQGPGGFLKYMYILVRFFCNILLSYLGVFCEVWGITEEVDLLWHDHRISCQDHEFHDHDRNRSTSSVKGRLLR